METSSKHAEKRTFSLPVEQARYIDALVASGSFASASEVIRAGLRALQERDAAVERWLKDEVVPVLRRMKVSPGDGIPIAEVESRFRAKHSQRVEDEAR